MLPNELYSKWDDNDDGKTNIANRVDTQRDSESLVSNFGHTKSQPENHDGAPFYEIIKLGQGKGFRQFFRSMPTRLSDYRDLCKSLDLLSVEVLENRNIRSIMQDMRRGKSEWDPEERRETGGLKGLARDSAFRLLYAMLQGKVQDSNMAYNATLFVVSHRRIFWYKTRKMVREAFVEQFRISEKQMQSLDKWSVKDRVGEESQEDDATTEEEDYYDSDFSF